MTFLNRMLASVGIGAARVDTQLENAAVRLGDQVTGRVVVQGGNVAQDIEQINLFVVTQYRHDDATHKAVVQTATVAGRMEVRPGETQEVPFSFPLAYDVPLSLPGTNVWIETGAAISAAVDRGDTDTLTVRPNDAVEALLDGASRLGLRLRRAQVEKAGNWGARVVQELEFGAPRSFGVTEVEMILMPARDRVDVIIEVDRKARGVASLFTTEFESRQRWTVTPDLIARGPDAVAQALADRIHRG